MLTVLISINENQQGDLIWELILKINIKFEIKNDPIKKMIRKKLVKTRKSTTVHGNIRET